MPTPIIPNAVKVTVKGELFGQLNMNVWHVRTAGLPNFIELGIINGIFQVGYAELMAPLSAAYTINEITSVYIGDADSPENTLVINPPQAGGQAAAPSSPSNVCLCVSLRSGFGGRSNRGRKYFSGIPEGQVADNIIAEVVCTGVIDGVISLIAALQDNATPMAIASYTNLTLVDVVTALCVDFFVDSQRRRLTGRGR